MAFVNNIELLKIVMVFVRLAREKILQWFYPFQRK